MILISNNIFKNCLYLSTLSFPSTNSQDHAFILVKHKAGRILNFNFIISLSNFCSSASKNIFNKSSTSLKSVSQKYIFSYLFKTLRPYSPSISFFFHL